MSKDICGSEDTTTGEPCQFKPGESCPWHDVEEQPDTGRPTKLSYERQEKIAGAIENGKSISIAARKNDVSPRTITNWAEKGEADLENGKENEFTEFFQRFRRALGEKEDWYLELILEIARENGDHRFLMSLLKNEFPDQWGDAETGVDADTVNITVSDDISKTWDRQ
jgi:transposase-like protein